MSSELGVERPTTLPLPEPQEERRVHFGDVDSACLVSEKRAQTATSVSKFPELRPKRLRSASFSGPGDYRYGSKRRKRCNRVSKFLLGGNSRDPLNLGSLDGKDVAQLGLVEAGAGAITKRSNAVRVIIPPNINDPLNLDVSSDNEDSLNDALQRQVRKRRRSRKRKRRLSEPSGESVDCESLHGASFEECQILNDKAQPASIIEEILPKVSAETLQPLTVNTELPAITGVVEEQKEASGQITPVGAKPSTSGFQRPAFKKQRSKSDNKIVSPVIPQPGVERKRHPSHSRQHAEKPHLSQQNLKLPKKFNPKNEHFQYGNYNKYYGYRNPDMTPDIRLGYLKREWFEGKEILDVGCNIGHITLTVARDFNPKRVVGIDIDKKLVNIAQKNIKHYLQKGDIQETNFPKSMRLLYGPLKPPVTADGARCFPYNIKFVHANYVLESDELLETVRPEFDVIMCLSITKWVHLNWGDSGLKRFFRRIFYNLKPGGRFILEPQGWPSYNKRRKLTMRIFENYKNIRLFPDKFNDYLLHEVGFSTSEKMITPQHTSRGFQRPIIVYTKAGGTTKPSSYEDKRSRASSTKRGILPKQQFYSSKQSDMHHTSKEEEDIRIAQGEEAAAAECVKTAEMGENDSLNPPPNICKKLTSDHAQDHILTDGSSCSQTDKVTVQAMDCVSNSQCSDKKESVGNVGNGEGLLGKRESVDNVCDNVNTKKSPFDKGGNCLTHSQNHKPEQCTIKSPCSQSKGLNTNNKNLNSSDICTKNEVLKTLATPVAKSDVELNEDVSQDQNLLSIGSRVRERTLPERTDSECLSATTKENASETKLDTVCEKSKKNFDIMEDAKK